MPETEKILTPETPASKRRPERPSAPERPEAGREAVARSSGEAETLSPASVSGPAAAAFSSADAARLAEIERILEDDLADLYFQIPEAQRVEFRHRGEQAAREIDSLLGAAKVRVTKIMEVIRRWLALIPGINRFFLEQEAKIKTDRLLSLSQRE